MVEAMLKLLLGNTIFVHSMKKPSPLRRQARVHCYTIVNLDRDTDPKITATAMANSPSNPNATSPPPPSAGDKRTRIYVGGLGEAVTAGDLRKIFSNLGAVDGVEIVRTKGRSFGYVDFLPSSEKSLAKLFSAYNGCSWKGGKLKLERAKEHYLDCLRREREENEVMEKGAVSVDENQNTVSSNKAVGAALDIEKLQIRMFIPKLGKNKKLTGGLLMLKLDFMQVKPLPYKGTGKHKYSFQRVEIPTPPHHFCACPDHSEAYQMESVQIDESLKKCGEINEEEISMMRSIMNKLLEREKNSVLSEESPLRKEEDAKKLQESPSDENSADDNGNDDLLINIKQGNKNSSSSLQNGRVADFVNEDKRSNGTAPSDDPGKTRKRKALATNKKVGSVYMDTHDNGSSLVRKRKRNLQKPSDLSEEHVMPSTTYGSMANHNSTASGPMLQSAAHAGASSETHKMTRDTYSKEEPASSSLSVGNEESSPTKVENIGKLDGKAFQPKEQDLLSETQLPNHDSSKPVKGSSWLQKSSWTQLVGDANGGSFSISQILPGTKFKEINLQKPGSAKSSALQFLSQKRVVAKHEQKAADSRNEASLMIPEASDAAFLDKIDEPSAMKSEKISSESVHKMDKTLEISESCPFMRNAASIKEWKNAKSAVSASLKKKTKKTPGDW
ncbi:REPRESSOR OF SILENCING 3-like protein [Drosera capensis]